MNADGYDLSPVHVDTSRMAQRPSDMRAVEKVTGLTFGEVMGAGTADTFQAIALIELRKRDPAAGRVTDDGELWELAGELEVVMGEAAPIPRPDFLDATSS